MKNFENIEDININSYKNSDDAYRDYLAVQEIVDNMNVLNPKSDLYQSIANDIYERCVALQYFEELLDNEQSDDEQSDDEQSDDEQSDNEHSDNEHSDDEQSDDEQSGNDLLLFVEQIRSVMTSDDLLQLHFKFTNYINNFSIFTFNEMRAIYTAFNEKKNKLHCEF